MKKEDYENLGALEKIIFVYLENALHENSYTIKTDEFRYDLNGYVSAILMFGGYKIRCSINRGGFICWHCDDAMSKLMRGLPNIESVLIERANSIIKENEVSYKQQRICELEKELAILKSA